MNTELNISLKYYPVDIGAGTVLLQELLAFDHVELGALLQEMRLKIFFVNIPGI